MPKFYFHLSNCDECFPDDIGYDLPDITVAHTRAQRLANLVMTTSRLSSYPFDWRRWTVTVVTDDSQGAILIIPFSAFGNATRAALSAFVPADRVGESSVRFGSRADILRCEAMSALPPKADIPRSAPAGPLRDKYVLNNGVAIGVQQQPLNRPLPMA
ncbi:MAG: hypothetical protein WBD15_07480 [Pseudolabrys sp.]